MSVQAVTAALTAAGHQPWAPGEPAGQPRFVTFEKGKRRREVLVGLNYAGHDDRSRVMADYLAALAAAGLTADLRADGYIHLTGAAR